MCFPPAPKSLSLLSLLLPKTFAHCIEGELYEQRLIIQGSKLCGGFEFETASILSVKAGVNQGMVFFVMWTALPSEVCQALLYSFISKNISMPPYKISRQ